MAAALICSGSVTDSLDGGGGGLHVINCNTTQCR